MKKVITIIICFIIILFNIILIVKPKSNFSEIENRALSIYPTFSIENIKNTKYMKDLENYVSDHYPFRNTFIKIRTTLFRILGKNEINNVIFAKDNYLIEKYNDLENKDKIIETINKFNNKLNNTSLKVMITPSKQTILENKIPKYINKTNDLDNINYIYNHINNGIKIDDILLKEKDNYDLFYKTDHHWTSFGSYFGYKEYMKSMNKEYLDINDLKVKEISNEFLGSTYSKVINSNQEKDKIVIFDNINNSYNVEYVLSNKTSNSLYNMDYLNKKDKYALFLDNNHPLIKIKNNNLDNNESILIIKDSFANSMIPLIANDYEDVYMIDPRYYKKSISKYVEENKIKEILILYSIGTLSQDDNILSIR